MVVMQNMGEVVEQVDIMELEAQVFLALVVEVLDIPPEERMGVT